MREKVKTMKSTENSKTSHNLLFSRKKPLTTSNAILSLLGFLLFLTGGLFIATAVIDAFLNDISMNTLFYFIGGIVAYKIGRIIMRRISE